MISVVHVELDSLGGTAQRKVTELTALMKLSIHYALFL